MFSTDTGGFTFLTHSLSFHLYNTWNTWMHPPMINNMSSLCIAKPYLLFVAISVKTSKQAVMYKVSVLSESSDLTVTYLHLQPLYSDFGFLMYLGLRHKISNYYIIHFLGILVLTAKFRCKTIKLIMLMLNVWGWNLL